MCKEVYKKGIKFESNCREEIERLSHCLDKFHTLENIDFNVKSSNKAAENRIELDLVYLKDPVKLW